ncbi:hypothetical protein RND81_04G076500 [Saponaria officinalis]|uniref:Uncharacterized protein n=1 Tax=Saponaria officinalis TaxID=3572 RepID=A0AAW1LIV6_SAPOF
MLSSKLVRHFFTSKQSLIPHFLPSQQHVFAPVESGHVFSEKRRQIHHTATSTLECPSDPFSLVADELSLLAVRMRSLLASEFPKLASGAEYFFKMGMNGKHFRPTALLLMATAFNVPTPKSSADEHSPAAVHSSIGTDLHTRLQLIAEITELIHVGGLLHGDITDGAETGRDSGPFNLVLGNKLAVLVGDFLLSKAYVSLASLENTEVLSLLGQVVEHLATGETMQMGMTSERCLNMQYYIEKTYYKRSSLISNSCKSIALLAGQTTEVSNLAYDYGKNLGFAHQLTKDVRDFTGSSTSSGKGPLSNIRNGIITAPLLLAMEEFPQLSEVMQRGFEDSADVDLALDYLRRSQGIERAKDLALKHANQAAEAIELLPTEVDDDVRRSRRALVDLTHIICENK